MNATTGDTVIPYPALVRRAMPEDIDSLLLFVPQILAETTLQPVSMLKVEDLIEKCVTGRGGSIAGIIDGPDGVDAGIGLAFCESETSDIPFIRAIWCGLHPSVRKHPSNPDDPRAHYGRMMFEFARWCHDGLERQAGHKILLQFDIATRTMLGAKMRLYQRNLTQIGASFAFGATGEFVAQKISEAETV